jgi:hypothetical protein
MKRTESEELIRALVCLKRASRGQLDDSSLSSIVEAQDILSEVVGQTLLPAQAARLLGVSQSALQRWTVSGDIPTVLTPEGRREVPLNAVVDLLEELELSDAKRPLSTVIRQRRGRSVETADLNRLVPPQRRRRHEAAQLHSLAYHRLVSERLDAAMIAQAQRRLDRWEAEDLVDARWIEEWRRVLSLPIEQVKRRIGARTTRASELRQTSPFAGVLTEQERARLVGQVEERFRP